MKLARVKQCHKLLTSWGAAIPVSGECAAKGAFPLFRQLFLAHHPHDFVSLKLQLSQTGGLSPLRRNSLLIPPPKGKNKMFLSGYLLSN